MATFIRGREPAAEVMLGNLGHPDLAEFPEYYNIRHDPEQPKMYRMYLKRWPQNLKEWFWLAFGFVLGIVFYIWTVPIKACPKCRMELKDIDHIRTSVVYWKKYYHVLQCQPCNYQHIMIDELEF